MNNTLDFNLWNTDSGTGGTFTFNGDALSGFDAYRAASAQDAHSLFADPRFTDAVARDFHLLVGSPAIDAGSTERFAPLDFDGVLRQGVAPDIGAFESIAGSSSANSVSGQVFQDTNGNGVKDAGETGLVGQTIFLDANGNDTFDTGETKTVSGVNGIYRFASFTATTYRVREVLAAGWMRTTGNPADVVAAAGSNVSDVDFGNFRRMTISGQVFRDKNGNGVKDTGELGLASRIVFLDANGDGVLNVGERRAVTNLLGNYRFVNLGPGDYQVRELLPGGWIVTSANPVSFAAVSGSVLVSFGNFRTISISGTVFEDRNSNGVRNLGEPGLAGVLVFLDDNNNGSLDTGEATVTTNAFGNFRFKNLGPGIYRVRQLVPAGRVKTTIDVDAINAVSGINVARVNFGNA